MRGILPLVVCLSVGTGVVVAESRVSAIEPRLAFEINQGQADRSVRYLARTRGYTLRLTGNEALLSLSPAKLGAERALLRMKLLGAAAAPATLGRDELPGRSNYLIGGDPSRWRTDVRHY